MEFVPLRHGKVAVAVAIAACSQLMRCCRFGMAPQGTVCTESGGLYGIRSIQIAVAVAIAACSQLMRCCRFGMAPQGTVCTESGGLYGIRSIQIAVSPYNVVHPAAFVRCTPSLSVAPCSGAGRRAA